MLSNDLHVPFLRFHLTLSDTLLFSVYRFPRYARKNGTQNDRQVPERSPQTKSTALRRETTQLRNSYILNMGESMDTCVNLPAVSVLAEMIQLWIRMHCGADAD